MVIFNELRISDDKQKLIVDCQMQDLSFYDEMGIQSIYIDWYKNFNLSGVRSDNAICIFENKKSSPVRAVRKCLNVRNLTEKFGTTTFANGLFYVIVTCDGDIKSDVSIMPCGYDNTVDVGIVPDWELLYSVGMRYVLKMSSDCNPCADTSAYENFIILWNSFRLAVETCDFGMIKTLWDKIVRTEAKRDFAGVVSGCGCKG